MEELGNTDCMAQLYCSLVSVAGHLLLTARAGDTVEPALLPGGCLDVTPPPVCHIPTTVTHSWGGGWVTVGPAPETVGPDGLSGSHREATRPAGRL